MVASLHARVNGAGPTGALAALALAAAGWRVWVHDPLEAPLLLARSRAYAFTHSSRLLLERLDLWDSLRPMLVPFTRLHLIDQVLGSALVFGAADLDRPPGGPPDASLGWIGQHGPLMALLLERLQAHPAIALQLGAPPPAGREPWAAPDLVVAADGPDSPTREALGIGCWVRPYRQSCLTVQVDLRGASPDEAWELLRPEGPFAVLPLGGRRFQLVWSAPQSRCRRLEQLGDAAFLDALAGALPDLLQPDALHDDPRAFPVEWRLARRLHRGATVLVGESAHRCHPVGGQGLNLCWRDVEVLERLAQRAAAGRLDVAALGAAYGRRRWADLLATLLATHLLVTVFSNRHPLLLPLRRFALALLTRLAFLRRLALGGMTHGFLPPRLPRRGSPGSAAAGPAVCAVRLREPQ